MAAEEGKVRKTSHDKGPAVLYVFYPSRYTSAKSYAKPVVKIEVSCLSLSEPYEMKQISSLVQQICSTEFGEDVDNAFNQTIRTVSPARTFLEKHSCFVRNSKRTSREQAGCQGICMTWINFPIQSICAKHLMMEI